jgi:hypothetical protein
VSRGRRTLGFIKGNDEPLDDFDDPGQRIIAIAKARRLALICNSHIGE